MSLRNFRRSKVAPPPAKYDPEWVNQLRRALEESILKPDDFTNSYPFNSPYLSSGRIEVTQISNVTGGASNVTGTFTKSSPHDEESETDDSHHWVMRRWQSPTHSGLAYYASPARLPEAVTVGPNVSGFRLNYDNLRSWLDYDTAAAALSLSTKICFQAPIAYTIQTSSPTGRVDDEMLAEASSYWYLSLQDLATATLSQAKYQGITNNDTGIIVDPRNVLNVDSPLKAVDDLGNGWTDLKLAATAADKYLYSTAIDTWAEGSLTAFGRSLLDDADATAGRNTLGALTGVWPATLGGTGQSSYTVGDLLYASTTTALSKLAAGTSGYVLTSGGAGVAPSWAAVSAGVTGSGTTGTIPKWSGASALTDSLLSESGTLVSAAGDLRSYRTSAKPGLVLGTMASPSAVSGEGISWYYDFTATKSLLRCVKWGTGYKDLEIEASDTKITQGHLSVTGGSGRIYHTTSSQGIAIGSHATGKSITGGEQGLQLIYNFTGSLATIRNALWGTGYNPITLEASIFRVSPGGTADAYWSATGLMLGANSAPGRKLEVRSTSAQQRWSYDASNYAEIAVSSAGAVTLSATGASDGFCLGDSGDNVGFYGVTPVARAAAYTQTYATAARTNPAVLTDSTTGTPGTTLVDVTAAHDQAKLNDNFASLNARLNTAMQLINALIDDSQAIGIAQ